MSINNNIRKLRLQKSMTQEELGECLGISGQAVSKWELGITSPDILLLPVLAGCFGVTIDSLFTNEVSRRYPGYGGERGELLAFYEESGLEKDFQKAEAALSEVILHEKATTEDYFNYGLLYQIRFHRDSAIALRYYRKTIEHGNRDRDLFWMAAHQQITNLLESMGRLAEAIAEHKRWRDAEPNCAWAHVAYSYALSKAGHLEAAYAEAMEAFRLDANDCNVLTNAGDLCSKMGKYEDAILYWDKSYTCDSSQISCLFSKAEMFASIGRTEEAIKQFEEILIWLNDHGYNMELEGAHPRRRICELREQLS
ncbi:MAG: helix-turn-helix domain-containing protein [Lachnospiraceae bacterium]|nr:helix-turn-helix domain-containing protein [Lachnospiraceae bacterium]